MSLTETLEAARSLEYDLTLSINRAQNRDQHIAATAQALAAARIVQALEDLSSGS